MRPSAPSVLGLQLLVYEALSYWCMQVKLVYEAFRYLKLLVYEALSY